MVKQDGVGEVPLLFECAINGRVSYELVHDLFVEQSEVVCLYDLGHVILAKLEAKPLQLLRVCVREW